MILSPPRACDTLGAAKCDGLGLCSECLLSVRLEDSLQLLHVPHRGGEAPTVLGQYNAGVADRRKGELHKEVVQRVAAVYAVRGVESRRFAATAATAATAAAAAAADEADLPVADSHSPAGACLPPFPEKVLEAPRPLG